MEARSLSLSRMPNICVATDTTGISMEPARVSSSLYPRHSSILDFEGNKKKRGRDS